MLVRLGREEWWPVWTIGDASESWMPEVEVPEDLVARYVAWLAEHRQLQRLLEALADAQRADKEEPASLATGTYRIVTTYLTDSGEVVNDPRLKAVGLSLPR